MENTYKAESLSFATQQVYAEFFEGLCSYQAEASRYPPRGSIVRKTIKDSTYVYIQYSEFGGTRQVSLGKEGSERVSRVTEAWERLDQDRSTLLELAAMLSKAGIHMPERIAQRVLTVLANQGIFDSGAVLIGSHAFTAYELPLGVVWSQGWRTADVDLAASDTLSFATPAPVKVEEALERTELPFRGIPALDPRSPSTSFSFYGNELRVDLLTPLVGKSRSEPIHIDAFGTYAQPLRFLDYLIEDAVKVALPIVAGVLVNVPQPARFAIHKLIVASRRPSIERAKAQKDLGQAAQLVQLLLNETPDELGQAAAAAFGRGRKWRAAIEKSAQRLPDRLGPTLLGLVD